MTATPCYLAEVREYPADTATELYLFGPDSLIGYLSSTIENDHLSGYADELVRLFRYQAGTLTELHLHRTGEERLPGDWLDWHYEVCDPATLHSDGSHVVELAFTVRIDGMA